MGRSKRRLVRGDGCEHGECLAPDAAALRWGQLHRARILVQLGIRPPPQRAPEIHSHQQNVLEPVKTQRMAGTGQTCLSTSKKRLKKGEACILGSLQKVRRYTRLLYMRACG